MDAVIRGIREYVQNFARRKRWTDPDEMIAEALFAYVKAMEKTQGMQIVNLDAYIQSWVTGACKTMLHRAKRHSHLELTPSHAAYVMDFSKELIEALKLNTLEATIVQLRLEGRTDLEISSVVKCSRVNITQTRTRLGKRLLKVMA